MDEHYPKDNESAIDAKGRHWMTVEELEDYAGLLDDVRFLYIVIAISAVPEYSLKCVC